MNLDLTNLINKLKEWNILLAANLNSSTLWVRDVEETQNLYHLVIALSGGLNIDVSSDNYLDLYEYVKHMIDGIEAGLTLRWDAVDIRKGEKFVRKQDQSLGEEYI